MPVRKVKTLLSCGGSVVVCQALQLYIKIINILIFIQLKIIWVRYRCKQRWCRNSCESGPICNEMDDQSYVGLQLLRFG